MSFDTAERRQGFSTEIPAQRCPPLPGWFERSQALRAEITEVVRAHNPGKDAATIRGIVRVVLNATVATG